MSTRANTSTERPRVYLPTHWTCTSYETKRFARRSSRRRSTPATPFDGDFRQVDTLAITHPKNGAVYWQGPVKVEVEITLTGTRAEMGEVGSVGVLKFD